jgi:hypothetical protein
VDTGVRGRVNVESMGGILIIQDHPEVQAEPSYVDMFSERSRAQAHHAASITEARRRAGDGSDRVPKSAFPVTRADVLCVSDAWHIP